MRPKLKRRMKRFSSDPVAGAGIIQKPADCRGTCHRVTAIMEESTRKRLTGVLLFLLMGTFVFAIFYSAYHPAMNPGTSIAGRPTASARKVVVENPIKDNRITLTLGNPVTVWKRKLVYHGIEEGRIHIAVYILELDPEVPYHHRIPIDEAEEGIHLAGKAFALVSYGKRRITLRIRGGSRQ
jgi:hypothetical protein